MPTNSTTSGQASRETVAKKIRFLMHNRSVTIPQMADRIGVTPDHLRYIVDGISKPTRHLIEKICAAFNVKPDFFGKDLLATLGGEPDEPRGASEPRRTPPLPFTPEGQRRKAIPIGVLPAASEGKGAPGAGSEKKKRKFDLAELAAHHQALLEVLIEKRVIKSDDYSKKLEDVRKRAGL